MPALIAPRLRLALVAAVALAAPTPALAQLPVKTPSSPDPLPPMPAPQPIDTTPPDVRAIGSDYPPSRTSTPILVAPAPAPAAPAPSPGAPPNPAATAPASVSSQIVGPPPDAATPRRRAWGPGTTLVQREAKIGAYIGPTFAVASVDRSPGFMLGVDFGVLLGERFVLGGAGKALATPMASERSDGRTFNLRMPYAGVTLAVALVRVKFLTIGVSTLLGGGRVCLNDERLDRCVNRAAMFVAEPEIGLQFAVTRFLRVVVSGGYRVVVAQAWSGPSSGRLGGMTGVLALRIGKF